MTGQQDISKGTLKETPESFLMSLVKNVRKFRVPPRVSSRVERDLLDDTYYDIVSNPSAYSIREVNWYETQIEIGAETIPRRDAVVGWYHQGNRDKLNRRGPHVAVVERVTHVGLCGVDLERGTGRVNLTTRQYNILKSSEEAKATQEAEERQEELVRRVREEAFGSERKSPDEYSGKALGVRS